MRLDLSNVPAGTQCKLRNGDAAVILGILNKPMSKSYKVIGYIEQQDSGKQIPQYWHIDGIWGYPDDIKCRELDIIEIISTEPTHKNSIVENENPVFDKERLDFFEKNFCTINEGINELKVNLIYFVGNTSLRKALDNSMNRGRSIYVYDDWIAISEALPNHSGDYLLYCPELVFPLIFAHYDTDIGEFMDFHCQATHWRTLPAPPKKRQ